MSFATSAPVLGVKNCTDTFLSLWPHRFDFIHASHPTPGEKPNWKTESRFPLRDRMIEEGRELYGVRFSPTTSYCLIDIDKGSAYHPQADRFSFERIREALEELSLVASIAIQSSDSGGIHLYLPFENSQKSWELGVAVTTLLKHRGFTVTGGQLEVFPNPRPYAPDKELSLYGGHRLPLQAGSYLLNDEYELTSGYEIDFVQQWQWAVSKNVVDEDVMKRLIKQSHHTVYAIQGGARKFLDDLNAEIDRGWSEQGQSNRILGRIALRSYVFGHVIDSSVSRPLEGDALVNHIVETAQELPGFKRYSNDVHCIERRAKEWARSVESNARYFHYGSSIIKEAVESEKRVNEHNVALKQDARARITQGIRELLDTGTLPSAITERIKKLSSHLNISTQTLYKHKDLWHPEYLSIEKRDCAGGASLNSPSKHLLRVGGCNSLQGKQLEILSGREEEGEPVPMPPELKVRVETGLRCHKDARSLYLSVVSLVPFPMRSLFNDLCLVYTQVNSGFEELVGEAREVLRERGQAFKELLSLLSPDVLALTPFSLSFLSPDG